MSSSVFKTTFIRLLRRKWYQVLAMVLFIFLGSIATLLMGWVLKGIIDGGLKKDLGLFLFSIVALGVGTGGRIWASKNLIADLVFDLRKKVYQMVMSADMTFHNKEDTGHLNNIFQDILWLEGVLNSLVVFFIRNISLFIGSLILMIYIDYVLSFYVICGIALLLLFYNKLVRSQVKKRMYSYREQLDKLSLNALDSWRAIEVVKSFHVTDLFIERFTKVADQIRKYLARGIIWQSVSAMIGLISIALFFLGILYLSLNHMKEGVTNTGDLIAFFFYLLVMIGALASSGENIYNLQELWIVLKKLSNFLNETFLSRNENLPLSPEKGICTEFEKVCFAYDGHNTVLNNLSFRIKEREKVAIMGVSGSGKTSILKIIAGFHSPSQGVASISQKPTSFAGQDPVVFNASLWNNLSYVLKDLDKNKAQDVLKKLKLDYLLERTSWDEELGESGTVLSGGEKQRLALARTLLSDCTTLLFDEITSSIDIRTEKLVLDFIFQEKHDCTVIFATHSLRVAERCDKIILIHKGQSVVMGSKKEVLSNRIYKNFLNFQSFLEN